jgi:hypothetical protein
MRMAQASAEDNALDVPGAKHARTRGWRAVRALDRQRADSVDASAAPTAA